MSLPINPCWVLLRIHNSDEMPPAPEVTPPSGSAALTSLRDSPDPQQCGRSITAKRKGFSINNREGYVIKIA
jgi:hypothetical protein